MGLLRASQAGVSMATQDNESGRVVHRLIAEGDEVVSEVTVTDGVVTARAITFSTVREGRIARQAARRSCRPTSSRRRGGRNGSDGCKMRYSV